MTGRHGIAASARMMRIVGVLTFFIPVMNLIYPPGFLWGTHPGDGFHPVSAYLFMLLAMYFAWAVMMIRGAADPLGNRIIVVYGILANGVHAAVMAVEAFVYPHEIAHLWADVPAVFGLAVVLWYWHPARAAPVRAAV